MLRIIQTITLLQGLFLLIALFSNRNKYKKPTFWLLACSIISIILYVIGDDENGFFVEKVDLFYFDASLFITFLFLFIKYFVSGRPTFNFKDLLYFLPNINYFTIEILEEGYAGEVPILIEIIEILVEVVFLMYLILCVKILLKFNMQKWMLFFVVPMVLIVGLSVAEEFFFVVGFYNIPFVNDPAINTYTLILVAFLFYFITLKLILAPSEIMLIFEPKKYKTSGLNNDKLESYSKRIIAFMEEEKGFMDSNLSLSVISEKLNIPKQYISEILNVHLNTNFQDFVNGYRIEAFIQKLNKPEYANLTLVGIANEVGFNSKSNFYTAFKKVKGLTPTQYRKTIQPGPNKS
jgi:AraC-like DNA-binding protein